MSEFVCKTGSQCSCRNIRASAKRARKPLARDWSARAIKGVGVVELHDSVKMFLQEHLLRSVQATELEMAEVFLQEHCGKVRQF